VADPPLTVAVCTRNRGSRISSTIASILANDGDFVLLVVDQSDDSSTEASVASYSGDPRLRYVRSSTRGLGAARNVALHAADTAVVVFTDDDVVVPSEWARTMHTVFERHPRVAVAFCNVEAGPHDPSAGFIPAYVRDEDQLVTTLVQKCRARGIGAGLAVRRDAALAIGGFDERLGAGGDFPSCEDGDIAVRALLDGWWVFETADVAVVHDGFRTWAEGRLLTRRDWLGIGAAYAKPLRRGRWRILPVIAYEGVGEALLRPLAELLRLRRPRGLMQAGYFWLGFARGWRAPLHADHLTYVASTSRLQRDEDQVRVA
jgi:glycosyltransferase involved in cell wall biosynthesis